MSLNKATLSAMIGVSYIFISRTIGTFFPAVFRNHSTVKIAVILSLLASITVLVFYISFYQTYVQKKQKLLKNTSLLAIIGSLAVVLLYLKGLLLIYGVHIFPYPDSARYLESIIPWISAVFFLLFFIVFYRETLHEVGKSLSGAALLAIIGSSVATLLRTFVLLNYFYSRQFKWFSELFREMPAIFLPISAFMFFTVFYFFLCFYKEQQGRAQGVP